MEKLFSILCAFLISSVIFFAGCSDKWTEVQSITYHTDSGSTTYTSMIYRDITYEEITENEYNEMKATQNEKPYTVSYYGFERLESSRLDTTNRASLPYTDVSKIYLACDDYYLAFGEGKLYKFTVNSYSLKYVEVKIVDKGQIDIRYDGKTIKVCPTSYEITYFED